MKRILHLLQITLATLCFVFSVATVKAQPLLVENFDYEAGALLTAYGWTAHSVGGTQAIDVVVPGLTFDGYPLSNIGGAALVDNNGEDVHRKFTVQTSGKVYAAFMVQVNGSVDGYFLHFGGDPIGTTFRPKLFLVGTGDPFNFGLSVGSNTATPVDGGVFSFGKTYLLVMKYEIVEGEKNDIVSLYIIDGNIPDTEPETPSIGPLTDSAQSDINPGCIAMRQFNAGQKVIVDGIRVATSWADAVTAALGGDTFPPQFSAGFPKISGISSTGATLEVSLDEPGQVFYMVVSNDAAAPTTDEVIAGTPYGGVTPVAQGTISVAEAGTPYIASLTGLADKTDYDIFVVALDDETTPNKQAEPVKLELFTETQPDILFFADFETSLEPFTQVNITGDQEWKIATYNNNSYAYMNGYASGNKENTDWLISPAINLDTADNIKVSFRTAMNYKGPDIKVMISSDFTGIYTASDIGAATWTDITSEFELSTGGYNWQASGEYALSSYSGKVYIAFVYTSTTEGAAGWEVDEFKVTGFVKGTGIGQTTTPEFTLYPVPARTELFIDNAGKADRADLYDLSGRLHLSVANTGAARLRMEVGHLTPGIYLVRFTTADGPRVQKFVKD